MKRLSGVILALLMLQLLALLLNIPQVKALETTLFFDDFESYTVGTFPSVGGWEIVWNGRGDQYQYVTDKYSYSPTKSIHLWGQTGWSCVIQRKFNTDAPVIGYEFAVFFESRGSGYADHPAFFKQGAEGEVWGTYYATVAFYHDDGTIRAEDGTIIGNWETRTWYKVRVILDRTTKSYNVWINGELRGRDLKIIHKHPELVDAIALTSAWPGVEVYYDDVKVFEVHRIVATIDIDPNVLNLRSVGKWVTAYIELPEGYDVGSINVSSIMLNDTIPVNLKAPTAIGDYDDDAIPDLMVKFDRAKVINYILDNIDNAQLLGKRFMTITLTITGKLKDGTQFQGSDNIKIIMPMPRWLWKIHLI